MGMILEKSIRFSDNVLVDYMLLLGNGLISIRCVMGCSRLELLVNGYFKESFRL